MTRVISLQDNNYNNMYDNIIMYTVYNIDIVPMYCYA